jgi:hypothetical protein
MGSTVDLVCARLISVSGGALPCYRVLLVTSENSIFNFDLLDRRLRHLYQALASDVAGMVVESGWRGGAHAIQY